MAVDEPVDDGFAFYKISFQWYQKCNQIWKIIVLISHSFYLSQVLCDWFASFLGNCGGQKLDPKLLSPFVQKMLPKKYHHAELKPIEKKISLIEKEDKELALKQELTELISQNDENNGIVIVNSTNHNRIWAHHPWFILNVNSYES